MEVRFVASDGKRETPPHHSPPPSKCSCWGLKFHVLVRRQAGIVFYAPAAASRSYAGQESGKRPRRSAGQFPPRPRPRRQMLTQRYPSGAVRPTLPKPWRRPSRLLSQRRPPLPLSAINVCPSPAERPIAALFTPARRSCCSDFQAISSGKISRPWTACKQRAL